MSKRPLPIPDDIKQMFEDRETSKFSEDHQGRIRSFPHREGDWPSFVYIPVKLHGRLEAMITAITQRAKKILPGFVQIDLNDLHISLSRTVPLRHYWIEPIVSKLKQSLAGAQSFKLHHDVVDIYTNDDNTRSFLGLRIILGEDQLKRISQKIDEVFEDFGLSKYYKNPSFHVSFAWHLGDVSNDLPGQFLQDLQDIVHSFGKDLDDRNCYIDADTLLISEIFLKTGDRVFCLVN